MKRITFFIVLTFVICAFTIPCQAQYTNVNVPEEGGINFIKLTDEVIDFVSGPTVTRKRRSFDWWTSPMLSLSPDGAKIAYLANKNDKSNVMIRNTSKAGASIQRTFRDECNSVNWSRDGEKICFGEYKAGRQNINMINALEGGALQQISTGFANDFAPCFSSDRSKLFFSRGDQNGYSIWSYDFASGLFTNYSMGITPYPIDEHSFLCTRFNTNGGFEIWMINYSNGAESMILGGEGQSFSTPILSPDKQWILCVGISQASSAIISQVNLDVYVVKIDGSNLTQLTFHPGDDASPIWSTDGKEIFFLSQRGTKNGEWNIWKMNFPFK